VFVAGRDEREDLAALVYGDLRDDVRSRAISLKQAAEKRSLKEKGKRQKTSELSFCLLPSYLFSGSSWVT
jgi:hypothetical protein